jgi:hypothetical protein
MDADPVYDTDDDEETLPFTFPVQGSSGHGELVPASSKCSCGSDCATYGFLWSFGTVASSVRQWRGVSFSISLLLECTLHSIYAVAARK